MRRLELNIHQGEAILEVRRRFNLEKGLTLRGASGLRNSYRSPVEEGLRGVNANPARQTAAGCLPADLFQLPELVLGEN